MDNEMEGQMFRRDYPSSSSTTNGFGSSNNKKNGKLMHNLIDAELQPLYECVCDGIDVNDSKCLCARLKWYSVCYSEFARPME